MVSNYHTLASTINPARHLADTSGHRAFINVEIDDPKELDALLVSLSILESTHFLLLPDRCDSRDRSDQITALLGSEHDVIVFNACEGFDPALFAASTGTIVRGGLLLLVTPSYTNWTTNSDKDYQSIASVSSGPNRSYSRFIERFIRQLNCFCQPVTGQPDIHVCATAWENRNNTSCDWVKEQEDLLTVITQRLYKSTSQVLVLQADRGRGKSALLGRVAAMLANDAASHHKPAILVTAPRIGMIGVMQKHFERELNVAGAEKLKFLPMDELQEKQGDILFVDEASSFPVPVLAKLVGKFRHIVYATTVQGYEGAGRGFALRFTRELDRLHPDWLNLSPMCPVRWCPGDPLESFVNTTLLIGANIAQLPAKMSNTSDSEPVSIRHVSQDELLRNEELLELTFGILTQAHYQTTPVDLRHLLDQPHMKLWVLTLNSKVCGAALVAMEGSINEQLHEPIVRKRRRTHNQLLPQLLAQCANTTDSLSASYARIVRIAIHPQRQRHGYGSMLVRHIQQELKHVDAIGASFGADAETLAFWQQQDFHAFHYGWRRNSRSGLRSVCTLQVNSDITARTLERARAVYLDNIDALRLCGMHDSEHSLFLRLIRNDETPVKSQIDSSEYRYNYNSPNTAGSSVDDRPLLERFAAGERSLIDTAAAIKRFSAKRLQNSDNQLTSNSSKNNQTTLHTLSSPSWPLWLNQLMIQISPEAHNSARQQEAALRRWVITQMNNPEES